MYWHRAKICAMPFFDINKSYEITLQLGLNCNVKTIKSCHNIYQVMQLSKICPISYIFSAKFSNIISQQ